MTTSNGHRAVPELAGLVQLKVKASQESQDLPCGIHIEMSGVSEYHSGRSALE